MTRIDFHVLPDADETSRARYACRLAAKAVRLGSPVHVHAADDASARALDALMWEWPAASFLAHELLPAADSPAPVTIGWDDAVPGPHMGTLVNLSGRIPTFFTRFERVAEIVLSEPGDRALGRERYRYYRHRGYPLAHHEIPDAGTA